MMTKKTPLAVSGTAQGILAGICIALGGTVYLSCDNKYVGAVLFCVALLTICFFGFSLYTGKIGLIVENHKKKDIAVLLTGLLGNTIACVLFGLLAGAGVPKMVEAAAAVCTAKLTQTAGQTFIRGIFCGILMYIAVWVYQKKNSIVGILFAIPVFILSGFEHSIADMYYFALARIFTLESAGYIALVILGNTAGSLILPLLMKIKSE